MKRISRTSFLYLFKPIDYVFFEFDRIISLESQFADQNCWWWQEKWFMRLAIISKPANLRELCFYLECFQRSRDLCDLLRYWKQTRCSHSIQTLILSAEWSIEFLIYSNKQYVVLIFYSCSLCIIFYLIIFLAIASIVYAIFYANYFIRFLNHFSFFVFLSLFVQLFFDFS